MQRRNFLKLSTAALLASGSTGCSAVATHGRTRADVEGPYYPVVEIPLDHDLISGEEFVGDALNFTGRVLDTGHAPLADVRVEIWQCDGNSIYRHPHAPDPVRADPAFKGFGATVTDNSGEFAFRTIVPVPYPGRPPHIHVKLWRNRREILTTQLYIEGYKGAEDRRLAPVSSGEHYSAGFEFLV